MMRVQKLDDGTAGPAQSNVYTRLMVGTRIEALKKLEEALSSSRRAHDPELVQDGCILIWNVRTSARASCPPDPRQHRAHPTGLTQ
eukprot:1896102-Prymnesium_polylepis.2